MEWQPIETAPFEQKEQVLVLDSEGNVRMAGWWSRSFDKTRPRAFTSEIDFGMFLAHAEWPEGLEVTHWMPIPPAPTAYSLADAMLAERKNGGE